MHDNPSTESDNSAISPGVSIRSRRGLIQVVKYGTIGAANTLITAVVIYLMQNVLGCSMEWSNVAGYAAGLLNSFVWNSRWTFGSSMTWRSFRDFMLVFALCYGLQMLALQLMKHHTSIDRYVIQLIAMLVYNVLNFLLNKYWVFKK